MAWRCEVAVLGPKQIENTRYYAAVASLREFDVSDVNAPLDELGSYLLAKSQARLDVHPRRMEELVASIFSNDGWDVSVTAYSKDGGIDVFLERGTERIGVQVKRYKHVIGVEQVRSLVGALVEHGEIKGIFVTTSTFSRGAQQYTQHVQTASQPFLIELIDGSKLLDALAVTRRDRLYQSLEEVPRTLAGKLALIATYVADASPLWPPGGQRDWWAPRA